LLDDSVFLGSGLYGNLSWDTRVVLGIGFLVDGLFGLLDDRVVLGIGFFIDLLMPIAALAVGTAFFVIALLSAAAPLPAPLATDLACFVIGLLRANAPLATALPAPLATDLACFVIGLLRAKAGLAADLDAVVGLAAFLIGLFKAFKGLVLLYGFLPRDVLILKSMRGAPPASLAEAAALRPLVSDGLLLPEPFGFGAEYFLAVVLDDFFGEVGISFPYA
jgi:hypothetical protein